VKIWQAVWPVGEFLKKGGINRKIVIFYLFAQKPPMERFPLNFAQM